MRILAVCIVACMPVVASGTTIISLTSGGQSSLTVPRGITTLSLDVTLSLDENAAGTFAFIAALACNPASSHLFISARTTAAAMTNWTAWDSMIPPPLVGSSLLQRIDFGYIEMANNRDLLLGAGATMVETLTVGGLQNLPNGVYTFTVVDASDGDLLDNRGVWSNDGDPHSFDIVEEFTLTLVPEPSTFSLLVLGGFILRRRVGSS